MSKKYRHAKQNGGKHGGTIGGKKKTGYVFYMGSNPAMRPYGVQCWCFRCSRINKNPYHRWEDPCPALEAAA